MAETAAVEGRAPLLSLARYSNAEVDKPMVWPSSDMSLVKSRVVGWEVPESLPMPACGMRHVACALWFPFNVQLVGEILGGRDAFLAAVSPI